VFSIIIMIKSNQWPKDLYFLCRLSVAIFIVVLDTRGVTILSCHDSMITELKIGITLGVLMNRLRLGAGTQGNGDTRIKIIMIFDF